MRRTLGRDLETTIGASSVGVEAAVLAYMTWDLATADGTYTTQERDILIGPWQSIESLP